MKLIAMYLPQFHKIPENDAWWGKGFTEWTNVKRGRAFYKGHYQPRVPYHNNYYDLANDHVMQKQVKQARKYGISGFCFYHYYFCGKKLLEKPAERFLKNKDLNIEFCFSWANQSWTRTWYGNDEKSGKMLLEQTYGTEKEWKEHFEYLLPFFKDGRYIKVDNKPVFLIYLPQQFAKINKMIALWNQLAQNEGFLGVYFIAMDTAYDIHKSLKRFDAIMEFEPLCTIRKFPEWIHNIRNLKESAMKRFGICKAGIVNRILTDNVCSYQRACKYILNRKRTGRQKVYLGAFPGWDNTARKDESGIVLSGSTPEKFEKLLIGQIKRSKRINNEFLFINAWNEWSEGTYLEPDEKYGYAYLQAVKNAQIKCELNK